MKILVILLLYTSSFLYGADSSLVEDIAEKYNRKQHFTGPSAWIDEDKDCQNTRAEVLIEENIFGPMQFRSGRRCVVDYGQWYDLYTNKLFYVANDMDIEHVVSLKDAWDSGADKWTFKKRREFANYLQDTSHLMAVCKRQNRSKGASGPDKYLPPNKNFVKEYCRRYIRIKVKWNLTVTRSQLYILQEVLGDEQIIYPKVR